MSALASTADPVNASPVTMTAAELVTSSEQLDAVAERARRSDRIALDTEGNSLHAYRSRLCVLQLAWREGASGAVAIVDSLALDLAPLAPLLGRDGPIKVLHDLTFDAAMLSSRGIALERVRDTSVAARFLDEPATGLASLAARYLGVTLGKGLQGHDWARRPLTDKQLAYLAGDVAHLLELDERLEREVERLGIAEEVELESRYKLACALAPPKEGRPAFTRIKGRGKLDEVTLAVLWQLVAVRERIAETRDQPPFRVAPNELLVALARRKPSSVDDLRSWRGRHPLLSHTADVLAAVQAGIAAGSVPPEPTPVALPRAEVTLRKRLERGLNRWRQSEASARGVSTQVVLPGHCLSDLVERLVSPPLDPHDLADIPGLGESRVERHGDRWLEIAASAQQPAEA